MESEQLYHRGYCRNSYNSIASASSDEELLDGAGVIMDFHTTEDDNLLDGDAASPGRAYGIPQSPPHPPQSLDVLSFPFIVQACCTPTLLVQSDRTKP